ncbi:hypothetical protein ACP4OV_024192 [Aristida adscensionis]
MVRLQRCCLHPIGRFSLPPVQPPFVGPSHKCRRSSRQSPDPLRIAAPGHDGGGGRYHWLEMRSTLVGFQ